MGLGARSEGARRGNEPRRLPRDQGGGVGARGVTPALPYLCPSSRPRSPRRLRWRHHRAAADRQPGSRRAPARRPRPAAAPGTYSNKCLINQPEGPLGCYDESRFETGEEMVQEILSVYEAAAVRRLVSDTIFEPLRFRSLQVPNRVFCFEHRRALRRLGWIGLANAHQLGGPFARAGVGAIVSAWRGVDRRASGRFASLEHDGRIPFWREFGKRVQERSQVHRPARPRRPPARLPGHRVREGPELDRKPDPLHGFQAERATPQQLAEIVRAFAAAAHRAREAGLDGVEIHGANGYLFTQFLSSAINDRKDEYGGALETRARLLVETLGASGRPSATTSTRR